MSMTHDFMNFTFIIYQFFCFWLLETKYIYIKKLFLKIWDVFFMWNVSLLIYDKSWFFFLVVVAINCYACNSDKDSNCGESFIVWKLLSDKFKVSGCAACGKYVVKRSGKLGSFQLGCPPEVQVACIFMLFLSHSYSHLYSDHNVDEKYYTLGTVFKFHIRKYIISQRNM